MADRDWDKELKRIDSTLESVSDEALFPSGTKAPVPASKAPVPGAAAQPTALEQQRTTSTAGVFLRLTLAVALGIGMLFWPYASRCGLELAAYMGATIAVLVAGAWSGVWTWRHRAGRAHVLSLLLVLWGLLLATAEILPRVGYAIPTVARPASWSCS